MRMKTVVSLLLIAAMLFTAGCAKKPAEGEAAQQPDDLPTAAPQATAQPEVTARPEGEQQAAAPETTALPGYTDAVPMSDVEMEKEAVIFFESSIVAVPDVLQPVASGEKVSENGKAVIDYSNTEDGYVMIKFVGETDKRLKTQIVGPHTTYTYNLYKGEWGVFPLTDGNGAYQFKVFQNVTGSQYSLVLADGCDVQLKDEFAPFLRPNQYVDYDRSSKAVEKARELTRDISDPLEKVEVIYNFVITALTYDKEKAQTVKSGYLPDLDAVMDAGKGICFDYAALMTGMLRSQGIPCKMVFGYAGSAYHAWISVWTEDEGWVDGVIFFDGTNWQRVNPTFASSGNQSEEIMQYIGNNSNYREKYLY